MPSIPTSLPIVKTAGGTLALMARRLGWILCFSCRGTGQTSVVPCWSVPGYPGHVCICVCLYIYVNVSNIYFVFWLVVTPQSLMGVIIQIIY